MRSLRVGLGSALGCAVLLACGARTPLGTGGDAAPVDASTDAKDAGDARDGAPVVDVVEDCPFSLSATVTATLRITTDDDDILYVGGKLIDKTPRLWSDPQTYTVTILRHPSQRNSIAIQGTNRQNVGGPDRGILADLRFTAGASEARVVTDARWGLSVTEAPGWFDSSFDASAWKSATVEGPYGMPPWGPVFGISSTASWLWSYDSNLPANAKPITETVWVHRDFYVDFDGQPRDTPSPCP